MPTPIVYYEWYNKKAEKKEQLNHLISFFVIFSDRTRFSVSPERKRFRETFPRFEFIEVLRRVVAIDSRSLNIGYVLYSENMKHVYFYLSSVRHRKDQRVFIFSFQHYIRNNVPE